MKLILPKCFIVLFYTVLLLLCLSDNFDISIFDNYNVDYNMLLIYCVCCKNVNINDLTKLTQQITLNINNGNKESKFKAYYVDYLCVDILYRKKNIAPQLIQTHHYNQRHLIKILLFLSSREKMN